MSDTFNMGEYISALLRIEYLQRVSQAWKIGYVLKGWAKQDILATYEEERKPISKELIELDRKIFKLFAGQTVTPEEYTKYVVIFSTFFYDADRIRSLWKREIMFASYVITMEVE